MVEVVHKVLYKLKQSIEISRQRPERQHKVNRKITILFWDVIINHIEILFPG